MRFFLITFISILVLSTNLEAKEYFGLNIGKMHHDEVIELLKSVDASYDDSFGYKGYNNLPVIKILSYNTFNKYGTIKESWLEFSPEKYLYKILVQWRDSGESFKIIKDALDSKYEKGLGGTNGFHSEFNYKDEEVDIELRRNTFGFGDDQTTTIIYTYKPLIGKVKEMKNLIEEDIKKKNAQKAAGDL